MRNSEVLAMIAVNARSMTDVFLANSAERAFSADARAIFAAEIERRRALYALVRDAAEGDPGEQGEIEGHFGAPPAPEPDDRPGFPACSIDGHAFGCACAAGGDVTFEPG